MISIFFARRYLWLAATAFDRLFLWHRQNELAEDRIQERSSRGGRANLIAIDLYHPKLYQFG